MFSRIFGVFVVALCCSDVATAFQSSSSAVIPGLRSTNARICTERLTSLRMSANGDKSDEMMKSVLRSLEDVKGREGFRGKDADKAIREVKEVAGDDSQSRRFLGSRRLAKAVEEQELSFKSMINGLKSVMGREGFRGADAEKAIHDLEEAENKAIAEEQDEKKLLGSRRLYKFTRAATKTVMRPVSRKNHPGEKYFPGRR
ncbi:hypothetical protein GUITHDRAFT_104685 [Guillardia theta CCMP2712]|uniref:Uncharacterized protein n=1 Tax=Guillardia theta (strain CCMP2712) TaxID=905079 RepID=L1JMP6_GUITC|nr:hypothetical protein GUITHDRAFT_104685 [Guillardia theta CCMP2712]EKX49722.1 hypothetical protein GUITHDRAFT_104685 [Guillardia theta CCMP2712]|eukprot:XP_005836702.1 hypothetical protein GUITHDRAFT_104685 [Guillardia theta CCMP2712]